MSPITLISPATCAATNSDPIATHFRKAKTLSRRPDTAEFFAAPLCVHVTAAVLSLKRPTCLQRRFSVPTLSSNMSHSRIFPAISRSFISKPPPGFFGVISLAHYLFVHSKRQTVGSSTSFLGNQTPSIPSPDASTQPRYLGYPMTNSFSVVGSREYSFCSVLQYQNACFAAGKYFH